MRLHSFNLSERKKGLGKYAKITTFVRVNPVYLAEVVHVL